MQPNWGRIQRWFSGLAVAGCLCLGAQLQAQPVAEYWTNGFPEAAINGWTTPWTANSVAIDAVTNSNPPLAGGAYYATFHTAITNGDTSLYRSLNGGLVATDIVVQAVLRVDALTNFTSTSDYIGLGDDNTATGGFSSGSDVIIRAYGASPAGSLPANEWGLYNGGKNGAGFSAGNMVDSGMAVVAGDTYVFSIIYHPSSSSYDTTISNANTKVSLTTSNLGYRASAAFSFPLRFLVNTKFATAGNGEQLSLGTITVNYLNTSLNPTILSSPVAATTNYVGQSQSFSVSAIGAGTLAYQWQVQSNGTYVNLQNSGQFSGATSTTLTISNLVVANSTNYQVVVTNKYGTAASSPAQLVVLPTGAAQNITLSQVETYGTDWNSPGFWSTGLGAQTSEAAFPGSTFEVLPNGILRTVIASYAAFPGQLTIDGDGSVYDVSGGGCGEMILKQQPGTNYFPALILNGGCIDLGNNGEAWVEGNVAILDTNTATLYSDSGTTAARGLQLDACLSGSGNIVLMDLSGLNLDWFNFTCPTNTYTGTWDVSAGTLLGSGLNSLGTNSILVEYSGFFETAYDLNSPAATFTVEGQINLHQDDTFYAVVINGTALAPGYYSFSNLNVNYSGQFPPTWTAVPGSTVTNGSGSITVLTGPVSAGSDPYLTGITLSPAASLNPPFATNVFNYTATVPYGSTLTVTVTNDDPTAADALTVNGASQGALTSGVASTPALALNANPAAPNVVTVQVTAANGATWTYTVNVTQVPSQTAPVLTHSVNGGTLNLSWPLQNLGYRLLVQTNHLNKGLSGNLNDWGTVPNSTATNTAVIPITLSKQNEYYELVYP